MDSSPRRTRGFTLVELLIVIAVVALLVGILLPTLRKARLEAWKTISLLNVRSIAQAGAIYQHDQKGFLPLVPAGVPVATTINAWITWGGWGKINGGSTTWNGHGGIFDIPASARPLNPYLTTDRLPSERDVATRKNFQILVCKDPSDKIGHQQEWNAFLPTFGQATENRDGLSCYDDVGTSYLMQAKWFFQTTQQTGGNWTKAWHLGTNRLRLADSFQPSRMIWLNDEWCDISINQASANARVKNGYGDINKGVCGFLDGHAKYLVLIPGGESNPLARTQPWRVPAFNNANYTVVFADLQR